MKNARTRSIVLYIVIALVIALIFVSVNSGGRDTNSISISEAASLVRSGEVRAVTVTGDQIVLEKRDGSRVTTFKESSATAIEQFTNLGVPAERLETVRFENRPPNNWPNLAFGLVGTLLPIIIIGGLILFMLRQSQGANNQAMSFGKSRARMFNSDRPSVTFEDVAGADESKQELAEVVEFLKEPEKFIQLGARIPKGVLMIGSPGTGKTLLSKAVAGEAGVPFFSISGSEFVEMFVGVGASRVRDLFDQAKRNSPCIIFIDEIDAVGRQRGAGLGGSHDEREQTLNQILVEMDGFDTDTNVIVIAATNRPDILDPALMRPGRFDRRVVIDRPDVRGREAILKVHVRGKPLAPDVDLDALARATPGFVGADLENMVNEGAILAARKNKKTISYTDLQEAIERVMMGPERRSMVISEREKRITAYHEAGHAIVGHMLPHADPVHKITIIPRGMAGGYTLSLPEEDKRYVSRSEFKDSLAMTLGGRAAEEIVFAEITTGAASDIRRVTRIARAMVAQYGMSDKLGPMMYGQKEEMIFLGREIAEQRDYSETVAEEIDSEVRDLVREAYQQALDILNANRDKLDEVAAFLIENETMDREFFHTMLGQRPTPALPQPKQPRGLPPGEKPADDTPPRPSLGTAPSPA